MDGTTRTFELKVGVFILIGMMILFFIVFSMGDINLSKSIYHIKVTFGFASGIGPTAPVRLAGVGVGQVEGIKLVYNEKEKKTYAEIYAWINDGVKIEEDSVATINTLGLLGEKYLEILPGTPGKTLVGNNGMLIGKDPVPMERITEDLAKLSDSVNVIVNRLKNGEGTIGRLLVDDTIYDNVAAFTEDIKKHPWKLLSKPKGE